MKLYAPNKSPITASADLIPGNALIKGFVLDDVGSLDIEWDGWTEPCWNGQFSKNIDGQNIYVSEDGREWLESQLCDETGTPVFPDRFPGKEPLGLLKGLPSHYTLSDTEHATVLAALRYYQANGQGDPANQSDFIHNIATSCGQVEPLDAEAIDDLCERINV